MTNTQHRPLTLIILDGWGYSDASEHNAIYSAKTPNWDALWQRYPHKLIKASGQAVGVPQGQMGNSEVGHIHMGAGRCLPQDLLRITQAIEEGRFAKLNDLQEAIDYCVNHNQPLHITGLLSPGGVHSHENHIIAACQIAAARGAKHVYVHAILDGRDTPPRSASHSLETLGAELAQLNCGRIASICGRYYAMDRDQRWDRTELAYDMLTLGQAPFTASSALDALEAAYQRGENDEFVQPCLITTDEHPAITVKDGDVILFMNFRADRARQLTRAFTETSFAGFERKRQPRLHQFLSLTEYAKDIPTTALFSALTLKNNFGEYIAKQGLTQLRIAETEKYAHVTFFFNGGTETPYPGEERALIPSPKVATYDLQPEMNAPELTTELINRINGGNYDAIICNFANPDMVGHTGNFAATVKAIECIDDCLGKIITALQQVGGEALITADHGNAEHMYNLETQQPHTAHSCNPVPLLYVGRDAKTISEEGMLYDLAPTMLHILGLQQPGEMTGKPLFIINE